MDEADAKQVAKIIKEGLELVRLPIENATEQRALALKFAIDTKGVAYSLKNDSSVEESADQVLAAARKYEAFIAGQ